MRIIIPEHNNKVMQMAMKKCKGEEYVLADSLEDGLKMLRDGSGDALIAGIDITTRDMVLGCKKYLPKTEQYFSSCFVMKRHRKTYILADAGVCKNPNEEMLQSIILGAHRVAKKILDVEPKIAMLSFSTHGSGGRDESITKINNVIETIRQNHPSIKIDGEMQLDVAIDKKIAQKKIPDSKVAGEANVLICPDLNSANILYKSMERFGGFTAAGPILLGFDAAVSDLSRGSTVKDVALTIETLRKLAK